MGLDFTNVTWDSGDRASRIQVTLTPCYLLARPYQTLWNLANFMQHVPAPYKIRGFTPIA